MRALCDVGASSKAAAKKAQQQQQQQQQGGEGGGQTGEKGIGFKSVFAVCDRPAIYSNGFAFAFDAQVRALPWAQSVSDISLYALMHVRWTQGTLWHAQEHGVAQFKRVSGLVRLAGRLA